MSSKYTEDWIPVNGINNGVIILENKLNVTGVKIMPRNIFILDEQSQANVLTGLKNFYNQIIYTCTNTNNTLYVTLCTDELILWEDPTLE